MRLLLSMLLPASMLAAIPGDPPGNPPLRISPDARHIARISHDTIYLVSGSTYEYTTDTPEGQGLVNTSPTTAILQAELTGAAGNQNQELRITGPNGQPRQLQEYIESRDLLTLTPSSTRAISGTRSTSGTRTYPATRPAATPVFHLILLPLARSGRLELRQDSLTANTQTAVTLQFTAGQRSPDATVKITIPAGFHPTLENTSVNVIGRGEVLLKDLETQSIGRTGSRYPTKKVGTVQCAQQHNGATLLTFSHLDLRPANGPDLVITIKTTTPKNPGKYIFSSQYTTTEPQVLSSPGTGPETTQLTVTRTISGLRRTPISNLPYDEQEKAGLYTSAQFSWGQDPAETGSNIRLQSSLDGGKTWTTETSARIDPPSGIASIDHLKPDQQYVFRLQTLRGPHQGYSNIVHQFTGKWDIKSFGASGKEAEDATSSINEAILYLSRTGGGTLRFSQGTYSVRTIHLQSNVYLYLDQSATITALKGGDAPEITWFSDRKYRSGLSPIDKGPYEDPENWLTKQDVGHHYFRNCMFFGERIDNIRIIGNGRITGAGNLVTGDKVMNNAPYDRSDKMFTLKLCTNLEIGGIRNTQDLWYDSATNSPYYIVPSSGNPGPAKVSPAPGPNTAPTPAANPASATPQNMLHIDRGGHFALLATGTDHIHIHDTWFGQASTANARDICDFMQCNDVTAVNIYSKSSTDDIIKPGSDCSLGFTRPAAGYRIRNIIGNTNCNLFQIGSETADDITGLDIDNIYVLGANKAGFSISTNDGALVRDVCLNCGHTGPVHHRSRMLRTFTPFFISVSNRGRILGAEAATYSFTENGEPHHELLIKNIPVGKVENIMLNGVDIAEVYNGANGTGEKWKAYDGTQRRATAIVAGYSLPDTRNVQGGLDFTLPDGRHIGYIRNIAFNDIHILVKGGNPASDTLAAPPELGVGQYNAANLKVQPAYGLWARHVQDLTISKCSFRFETRDNRYPIYLDDVAGAKISGTQTDLADDRIIQVRYR